jgi:Flp pilus assembly protein TadD
VGKLLVAQSNLSAKGWNSAEDVFPRDPRRQVSFGCKMFDVVRPSRPFLLASLLLLAVSATVPQVNAPSGVPHEPTPADAFKQASELLTLGRFDQAAGLTKQGLTQSPHSIVGLNLLGVIYQQQGKYQEAVAQFQQALTINPNSVDTLVNLGTSLAAQNKNHLAEQSLKKALRLQTGNKTAIYNLGAVLLSQQRPKESLSYLQR